MDFDRAAAGRIFDGVGQKIAEHLKQEFCVANHRHGRCGKSLHNVRPRHHLAMQLANFLQHGRHVHFSRLQIKPGAAVDQP